MSRRDQQIYNAMRSTRLVPEFNLVGRRGQTLKLVLPNCWGETSSETNLLVVVAQVR
jgi:hypothetical protein